MSDGEPAAGKQEAAWREPVLRSLLVSTALLGPIAFFPSIWVSYAHGSTGIAGLNAALYAITVWLAVATRLPVPLRVWAFVGTLLVHGFALMVGLGASSSAHLWIGATPVAAAALAGRRAGMVMAAVVAAALAVLVAGAYAGWYAYLPEDWSHDNGRLLLVVQSFNMVMLSAALAWAVGSLLMALETNYQRLQEEAAEREAAAAEQKRLESRLVAASRLEAVGHLASGIAHDFNNLLVPILGYAGMLRASQPLKSEQREAVSEIVAAAERGRSLIQGMLTASRRNRGSVGLCQVAGLMRETGRLLRAGYPASVDIHYDIDDESAAVVADTVQLQQVLLNLGTNAAYAMQPSGGRLTLATRTDATTGTITISVGDTGTGMTPDVLAKACEPFFTTKPPGQGTGLGLSTVQSIVTALDGQLAMSSVPGVGTTVDVTLPLHRQVTASTPPSLSLVPAAPVAAPAVPSSPRLRMLVVDDDAGVLKLCASVLRKAGHEIVAFDDPRDAHDHLQRHAMTLDMLVTDRMMPGIDGPTLRAIGRRMNPSLAVVLTTGLVDEATAEDATRDGTYCLLAKPFTPAELLKAIKDASTMTLPTMAGHDPSMVAGTQL